MTALQQLERYLADLRRRLRWQATFAGAAVSAGAALLLTLALTWFADLHRFAPNVVLPLRILLFAAVAYLITFCVAIPVTRLNRRRVSQLAESRIPDLHQRLLTATERPDPTNPFTELIAEDALRVAREHGSGALVSPRILYGSLAGAVIALAILCWMVVAGPGRWGYGAGLLWTGTARASARPLYDVAVRPGNTTIRRKADQLISAQLIGFSSRDVVLHARYQGALNWDQLPMSPQPNGNGYQLLFPGLSDSLEYYVQAGGTRSKQFLVRVKDLPAVKRVRVAIHYPSGIGLKDVVDDPGGDIRAVQGSRADISILTDKPLTHGLLVLEDGTNVPLNSGGANWTAATLPITKDGSYHVAVLDNGQTVRISEDYFIEAKKDEPPTIRISQPGRDPHVSPIEEVPVTVEVADDFGVHDVDLHYSVNGGPEQVRPLLHGKNVKEAQPKTMLSFEDFKLAPGDLVSFYATAQDGSHTSRSDIVFAQADPFDFKFRQSQQMGGGQGGASNEETKISERQKEVIAATWNELKDASNARAAIAQNTQFLSGMEGKLGEQAKALSQRMANRDLVGSNPEFQEFSKAMLQASSSMSKAVGQLGGAKWTDALPPEQQALQSLLHAESVFRDIQVAFGQRGAGGGMSSGGEERELARLFDLELDTSKNQYETGQSPAEQNASSQDQQKKIDDALQRLKELARRQQELVQQPRTQQQEAEQRWQQEQLRREAEQLRQQMQQLAQNGQSQGGQSSAAQKGEAAGAQQSTNDLRKAEENMRAAASNHDPAAQRRAAEELARAQQQIQDMLHQQAGNSLAGLSQKARQLAAAQRDLANRIKGQYGASGINTMPPNDSARGETQMPEMNGPGFARGFRRRRFLPIPEQPATKEERALAGEGDKLAQQLEQLQSQMQAQAQGMQAEQPEATRKLRKAVSDAEEQELATRMQKNSEWLREGYGSQTWPLEDSVTAGTEQLSRQLHDAEQSLNGAKSGEPSSQQDKMAMAQALAQVQSLRQQLQANAGNPTFGGANLNQLRAQLGRNDRQLNSYLNDASGSLRRLNAQPGLLDARLTEDAITSLGRLELELARRIGLQNDGARTGSPETAPEAYRQAVATYFRTLSQ